MRQEVVLFEKKGKDMERVEKTVFLSYRRTNVPWALAISQELEHHGFDVFFDFEGIASGDFEQVISGNITSRAHFLVLLTPSALERCGEPGDWLRREIETAIESQRNIVPLLLEGCDIGSPAIARQLTGGLEPLRKCNALNIPADYFIDAMRKLREKYLNVPLSAVLRPASAPAKKAAEEQKVAAATAPKVEDEELTAQQWFERGKTATDLDEKIRLFSEAIRAKPDFGKAHNNRGQSRYLRGDHSGAVKDLTEAVRLMPDSAVPLYNRAGVRAERGDLPGAIDDCTTAIRLDPSNGCSFCNRGLAQFRLGNFDDALADYAESVRLQPDNAVTLRNRGICRRAKGDLDGASADFNMAIQIKPDWGDSYYDRGVTLLKMGERAAAERDFQRAGQLGYVSRK